MSLYFRLGCLICLCTAIGCASRYVDLGSVSEAATPPASAAPAGSEYDCCLPVGGQI